MSRTVYGIHNNNNITFLDYQAAEEWLLNNYPEYCTSKDAAIEFTENMIWEDKIIRCEGCDEVIILSDMDDYWVKPGCCDTWFHSEDCHN